MIALMVTHRQPARTHSDLVFADVDAADVLEVTLLTRQKLAHGRRDAPRASLLRRALLRALPKA